MFLKGGPEPSCATASISVDPSCSVANDESVTLTVTLDTSECSGTFGSCPYIRLLVDAGPAEFVEYDDASNCVKRRTDNITAHSHHSNSESPTKKVPHSRKRAPHSRRRAPHSRQEPQVSVIVKLTEQDNGDLGATATLAVNGPGPSLVRLEAIRDSNTNLDGSPVGTTEVFINCGGVCDGQPPVIIGSPVSKLLLLPAKAYRHVHDSITLTAIATNDTGAPVPNAQVVFAVHGDCDPWVDKPTPQPMHLVRPFSPSSPCSQVLCL